MTFSSWLKKSSKGTGLKSMFFRLIGVFLVIGVLMAGEPAFSQEKATQPKAAEKKSTGVPPSLADVPGVVPGMTDEQFLDLANRALESERLKDAEKILNDVVSRNQDNISYLRFLASIYERQALAAKEDRLSPDAQERYKKYIENAITEYLKIAQLALNANDIMVAEEMYNRVLVHDSVNSQAQLGLARVYTATDRILQAISWYNNYTKTPQGEKDSQAYLELGKLYRQKMLIRQALSALQSAKKLDPENPDIYVELAYAQMDNKRRDEAVMSIQTAISKAPRLPDYHHTYAQFILSDRNIDEAKLQTAQSEARAAVRMAREQLKAKPDDLIVLQALNNYYATYRQVLERILTNDTKAIASRIELAKTIEEHARINQVLSIHLALNILLDAEGTDQEDVRLLEEMAQLQLALDKKEDAAHTARRLLDKNPDNKVAKEIMKKLSPVTKVAPK